LGGGSGLIRASYGLLKLEGDKGRQGYIYLIFGLPILYIIWYIIGCIIAPLSVPLNLAGTVTIFIITMCFAFIVRTYLNKGEIRDRFS
jgi:hypothetical protein